MKAFVIADGDRRRYRTYDSLDGFVWTDKLEEAIHYARRCDADKMAEDDEDAWHIVEVFLPSNPDQPEDAYVEAPAKWT